jgi:hypothetical protein
MVGPPNMYIRRPLSCSRVVGRRLGVSWPPHDGAHRNVRPSVHNKTRSLSLMQALRVNSGTSKTSDFLAQPQQLGVLLVKCRLSGRPIDDFFGLC